MMQQPQQPPSVSTHDTLSKDAATTADSLSVMMHNERTTYKCCDYLHQPLPPPCIARQDDVEDEDVHQDDNDDDDDESQDESTMITEDDRLKIVDWCYSVVDQCNFDRETVAIAMDMVDRFLSTTSSSLSSSSSSSSSRPISSSSSSVSIAHSALYNRKCFQLLSMSALYSAIKMNEKVALGSQFFSAMSRGTYSVEDIESMELTLLNALAWRCCVPTSISVAHSILSLLLPHLKQQHDPQDEDTTASSLPDESMWGFILDEIRFQTESAVRDYYFTSKPSSTIAMAAIFNALTQIPRAVRQRFLRALLSIMNMNDHNDDDHHQEENGNKKSKKKFKFDSPQELLNARNRLKSFIEGNTAQDHHHHDGGGFGVVGGLPEDDGVIGVAAPVVHQPRMPDAGPHEIEDDEEDYRDDDDDDAPSNQAAAGAVSSSLKRGRSDEEDESSLDDETEHELDHEESSTPRRKAARIVDVDGSDSSSLAARTVSPTDR